MYRLEKYCSKFGNLVGESQSGRSKYYKINNKILRLSDHIGNNSSGNLHIIEKNGMFIIHRPSTGTIDICSYRQAQEYIRILVRFPELVADSNKIVFEHAIDSEESNTILGIPADKLTPGQLQAVQMAIKKHK